MAVLSQIKYDAIYQAIQELHEKENYPIQKLCDISGIQRSSYYKWRNRQVNANALFNTKLIPLIKEAYQERDGILGYRQMTIKLNREYNLTLNYKRIYRLMKILHIQSVCRKKRKAYIHSTPETTAENILNREFSSNNFGEKWLTDVTEMKYGIGGKAYLSAILDLGDKSIVAFVLGHSNNNELVFKTFDIAHKEYPDASPLFHSDRGFQYT
ncbi:IS3 family transposase, partial [Pelosinus propionicus]